MTQERETVITARGVTVRTCSGEPQAEISFSILKKGIHGILGPVGSGKGALLRLLAGIDKVETGEIEMGGVLLPANNLPLRSSIAYIPATSVLMGNMTVEETLEFAGNAKRVRSDLLFRQIKEAEELLALDCLSKRLVSRLTEAERWRLTLAMALLGNPEILLMDEPMHSLGEDSYEARAELLTMLGQVKTVVLSTSSYSLAKALCEDVILLSDGRCLAQGSFEELESRLAQNGSADSLEELYLRLSAATGENQEEVAE